jgi:hypothetical protein
MIGQARRISMRFPLLLNRISPLFLVAVFAVFELILVIAAIAGGVRDLTPLIAWIGFILLISSVGLWRQWKLVDEVWDVGDALIVRSRGLEERIALSDIEKVSYHGFIGGSRRITLWLRRPSAFGHKIAFTGRFFFRPVVKNLNRRIALARSSTPIGNADGVAV